MPSSEIAGSYVSSIFRFWGTVVLFSIVAAPVCSPARSVWGSLSSTSFLTLVICFIFDDSWSHKCEVILHSSFDLHFLIISDVEHICMYLMAIFISSLEESDHLFRSSVHFLIELVVVMMLNFMSYLNIFCQGGWLFLLLMFSFTVQKLLSFMESYIFFAFIVLAWGDISKKILHRPVSKSLLPMFSYWNFMVHGLILIHFKFIFVHIVRKCSSFVFLQIAVPFSQQYILRRFSFSHCIFLPLLS